MMGNPTEFWNECTCTEAEELSCPYRAALSESQAEVERLRGSEGAQRTARFAIESRAAALDRENATLRTRLEQAESRAAAAEAVIGEAHDAAGMAHKCLMETGQGDIECEFMTQGGNQALRHVATVCALLEKAKP